MIVQKSKERAVAKVMGVLLLTLAAWVFINGIVFFLVRASIPATQYRAALRATYLGIALGCFFGGLAWAILSAFTLKVLYTSNNYNKMLGLGIVNAIFIFTFPLTILMIIVAKMECTKNVAYKKK